jgi:hypothetical protein
VEWAQDTGTSHWAKCEQNTNSLDSHKAPVFTNATNLSRLYDHMDASARCHMLSAYPVAQKATDPAARPFSPTIKRSRSCFYFSRAETGGPRARPEVIRNAGSRAPIRSLTAPIPSPVRQHPLPIIDQDCSYKDDTCPTVDEPNRR